MEQLESAYESVLRDLSTIYSIGYTPLNEARDGKWRNVKVEVKGRADLTAHTRRGYFARK